jgi:outer membrane receptor protein involved in Fe transport
MQTMEAVFEKKLGQKFEFSADAYHYSLYDLITEVPLTPIIRQYQNAGASRATGFELEATAKTKQGVKANASLAVQGSVFGSSSAAKVNAPARVGKLMLETPLAGRRLWASGTLQYLSERGTFMGSSVPAVYLLNFALASRPLAGGVEVQFGIRNLLDRRYWDPAGTGQVMDRVEQDGRCFFVRLAWSPPLEKPSRSSSEQTLARASDQP